MSSSSWVASGCCVDIDDGGRWSDGVVEEPSHARDRGGIDQGVEAAVHRLDQTWARAAGRPGCGGARGGTSCRGGSGVEKLATLGCRRSGAEAGFTGRR
jgi:hypothetical protein